MEAPNEINSEFYPVSGAPADPPTYWLTRYVILRLIGVIYAVAFLAVINQILPLIGANRLLPVGNHLKQISSVIGSTDGFVQLPSVFWFGHSDAALLSAAWIGFALSCAVVAGYANALMLFALWFLYMSFVHVGQDWYGYGWEIQLTETGFWLFFFARYSTCVHFPSKRRLCLLLFYSAGLSSALCWAQD